MCSKSLPSSQAIKSRSFRLALGEATVDQIWGTNMSIWNWNIILQIQYFWVFHKHTRNVEK